MRIAIIGYGICGSFAALWANELGFDVTVYEKTHSTPVCNIDSCSRYASTG